MNPQKTSSTLCVLVVLMIALLGASCAPIPTPTEIPQAAISKNTPTATNTATATSTNTPTATHTATATPTELPKAAAKTPTPTPTVTEPPAVPTDTPTNPSVGANTIFPSNKLGDLIPTTVELNRVFRNAPIRQVQKDLTQPQNNEDPRHTKVTVASGATVLAEGYIGNSVCTSNVSNCVAFFGQTLFHFPDASSANKFANDMINTPLIGTNVRVSPVSDPFWNPVAWAYAVGIGTRAGGEDFDVIAQKNNVVVDIAVQGHNLNPQQFYSNVISPMLQAEGTALKP